MKNSEEDFDKGLDLSEKAFKMRFRQIDPADLPSPVKRLREAAARKLKSRVTIYFDSDILSRFKQLGESEGIGYQTLMNQALRKVVEEMEDEGKREDLKEDILSDKKFLKRLKSALSA